ncbi:MAG TPA: aspartate aminotransferase family protein [Gammaproteobacteria bacterium]|nr:aspartate aminotransferase family protein [Gammaproteobacteria bacterium]
MTRSAVLHRSLRSHYPLAVRGEGVYVYDSDGKAYLDACGGAAVSCLGYSNEHVRKAIASQLSKISYIHSGFFTTEPMERLADELITHAAGSDDTVRQFSHIYFVSGGSEAVESAIKLARQYFLETDQPQRHLVIARQQSYHGNTIGALSVGGNMWRRQPFDPILLNAHLISPCYPYRYQVDGESAEEYGRRAANELEAKIKELGEEQVMAFIAEPVVGATLGAMTAVPGYFKRIREICDQYGVLLILDEIMCGMGRTGTLHACEQDGIVADIQTVAKGIASGYQPLGAVYVSDKITAAIEAGSGYFQHGHTYIGHALACAAGLATQQEIRNRDLLKNVKQKGLLLKDTLHDVLSEHPHVGDIRGRGLFIGIELVADKISKTPFDPALALHKKIKLRAMEQGLMCYPMGGTVDGKFGDHILLAPPFIVEEEHVQQIVEIISSVIKEVVVP